MPITVNEISSELVIKQQRYFFIELLAWWQGEIHNDDLIEQFKLSRQQAQEYLKHYCQNYPDNLYRKHKKLPYSPSENFKAAFINCKVEQYWLWLQHKVLDDSSRLTWVRDLDLPSRHVKVEIIRALYHAIKYKRRIDADYRSLLNPEKSGRMYNPHSLICAGQRWYVRGYCEKTSKYLDFAISRFHGIDDDSPSIYSIENDELWNKEVELILKPDDRLNADQKWVIENDYDMENGQLIVKTRAALLTYILHELRVGFKMIDGNPEAQQLQIVNYADIKDYLFGK